MAEAQDAAAIALGRPGDGSRVEMHHGFALGCGPLTGFAAGHRFLIERLGNGCGTADVTELEDFDLEVATLGPYLQHVTNLNFACRLHGLPPRLNPS